MTAANEVRLLLACARLHLGPQDRRELRACLDAPLDWERVLRLATWHGLRPLLHRHIAQIEGVPRAVVVECWGAAEAIARRNRAMRSELERILALLASAGIRALPYKGPTLALRAYGDLSLREFGDLDILVAHASVQRARDLLCEAGYVPEYPLAPAVERAYLDSSAQYHLVVRPRSGGSLVELHWKSDPDFPIERLEDDRWWSATGTVDGLPALCDEDLILVLGLHGSKHFWASLGWLVDVAEILRADPAIDWDRFVRRATSMRATRRLGLGLWLAANLLGVELPGPCRALAGRPDVGRLARAIQPGLLAPDPCPPGPWESTRLQWGLQDGWPQGIRSLVRTVCAPSLVEWTRWPLPKPLHFAYPVLRVGRLAGKYLRRGFHGAFRGRKLHT